MDASNPDTLYAATYQRMRKPWGFNGGGPGSGIYKTTDGGEHWTELKNGLPQGDMGRIGLAISQSNPRVLMALVETADRDTQGTYRSEDGGASWTRVSPQNGRPMYYSEIFIDPNDANTVYTLATSSYVSHDGGRNWKEIAEPPTYDVGVHSDHHALWIDPNDPEHLYLGGDGGLWETYDGGAPFRKINNFPIGQFYAIAVDMRDPYWVYGGLQDNHSCMGPSETRRWAGILNDDWMQIGFSDGMPGRWTRAARATPTAPPAAATTSATTPSPATCSTSIPRPRRTGRTASTGPRPSSSRATTPTCSTWAATASSSPTTRARCGAAPRT